MLDDPAWGLREHDDLLTCALAVATPAQAERVWPVLDEQLRTPHLWPIALALISQPGPQPLMERLKSVLREHPRCPLRALWMTTWASAEEARAALGAPCWRLQAAALERLRMLGVRIIPPASTADFLRAN
jgi:hypothetical protein